MDNERKRRSPVVDRLVKDISARIQDNEFGADAMLPSIRKLALEYAASPRTVETALHQMCESRTLMRVPHRGYKVPAGLEKERLVAVLHQDYGQMDPRPMITNAICDQLREYGYGYETFDIRVNPPDIDDIVANYSAVISARYTQEYDNHDRIVAGGIPHVIANRENDTPAPSSFVDRGKLLKSSVRMLYHMGHRKIAIIVRDADLYFYPKAIRAFREIVEELQLTFFEEYIAEMKFSNELGAYLCTRELLKQKEPPTAIVAGRDYQCSGIYQACVERGLVVGRDISVFGYDDIGWPEGRSFLTTYAEPCEKLGRTAVHILHDILSGREDVVLQREIEVPLLMRQTVAPILRYLEHKH
jgi:DNA-binding LacI/PurR family transcriptional regulator